MPGRLDIGLLGVNPARNTVGIAAFTCHWCRLPLSPK
jgi:hypothetical protein